MNEFDNDRLQAHLTRVIGQGVRSLRRIRQGAQSLNYAGVREDGVRFVLKLVPFARERQYQRLVDHLESVQPGLVVRELLPRHRFDLADHHALLLEWCAGGVVPFDRVFKVIEADALLADYQRFSASIQTVHELYPTMDYAKLLAEIVGSPIGKLLGDAFTVVDFGALAPVKVIHGDWQPDNLRFDGGRLSAVLDIEEFRRGSPVEDFARYVGCTAGHLPWYRPDRRHRLRSNLVRLVRSAPYSTEEWTAALCGQLLERLHKFVRKGAVNGFRRCNLQWHIARYRDLIKRIREAG